MAALKYLAEDNKRLAIFLDGTWNSVCDNTNVWRLRALCSTKNTGDQAQLAYYDIGVNGFLGGMFGKGLIQNVTDAYEWLIENYNDGDEIFVFGFSRGAFTARALTGLITKYGLLKPGGPLSVNQLLDRYRRQSDRTIRQLMQDKQETVPNQNTLEEKWLLKYSMPVTIKLVAVWDTVGALGVPGLSWDGISRSTFRFLDTGLRIPIENAFHAIAIDEHRKSFSPTLWTKRIPRTLEAVVAAPRPITSVEQRWFVGAHANVGGGYQNDLLAQAPLKWIMSRARLHGLHFRDEVELDDGALEAPIADSYKAFMNGAYSKCSTRHYRDIGIPPRPDQDSTYINVNETIDAGVFDRCRQNLAYRPSNLIGWAARQNVRLETLHGSISVDDPKLVIPD